MPYRDGGNDIDNVFDRILSDNGNFIHSEKLRFKSNAEIFSNASSIFSDVMYELYCIIFTGMEQ